MKYSNQFSMLVKFFPIAAYSIILIYFITTRWNTPSQLGFWNELIILTLLSFVGSIVYYFGLFAITLSLKLAKDSSNSITQKVLSIISVIVFSLSLYTLTFNYDYIIKMISISAMIVSILIFSCSRLLLKKKL
jgi:hypothetical protein